MTPSESKQARDFAKEVGKLIDQLTADKPSGFQQTVDYLTLMHTELLEFADDPADARLRGEVEKHIGHFLTLYAQARLPEQ
ncbi:hypothetical protein AB0H73_10065 [Streptomyces olivoreticuli]